MNMKRYLVSIIAVPNVSLMHRGFPSWEGTNIRTGGPAPGALGRVILETRADKVDENQYDVTFNKK